MLIETVFGKTLLCSSEVLGHIYRCAVATEKKLSVKTVRSEVAPYGAVLLGLEYTRLKSLLDKSLSEQICLRLIICPVEADAEVRICLVESFIYPSVHGLPEFHDFRISLLPLEEHLLSCLERRSCLFSILLGHASCNQFIHFLLVKIVECHVVVAYKVVTLLSA